MQNLFFCKKKQEEETLNLVAHQALLLDNVVHQRWAFFMEK